VANKESNRANKGNPASKRMSNAHRKEYRKICWIRGERRKGERKMAQLMAAQRNEERGYTEWDIARHNRFQK
jgi:hypothetical protein